MTTKYTDLEIKILKDLKAAASLGNDALGWTFQQFHEGINEDVECTTTELNQTLKVLFLEGLIDVKIVENDVTLVIDITGFGLRVLRELV